MFKATERLNERKRKNCLKVYNKFDLRLLFFVALTAVTTEIS